MLDEEAATLLATELLGRPSHDPDQPWHFMEFPEGWLIRENLAGRGGVAKVIERATGKIKYFPSYIAPQRILERYSTVSSTAQEITNFGA